MWSRELNIPLATLEERLQFAKAFPGRSPDGHKLLSYCEVDVRRLCADLITKPGE
jgi:hypothetical protein